MLRTRQTTIISRTRSNAIPKNGWAAFSKGVDMRIIDRNVLCALLLCCAGTPCAASGASAADENASMHSGFQFGLGAGGGQLQLSIPDTPGSINLGAFAYTFFAGYRIDRWAAVEASYLDGGP